MNLKVLVLYENKYILEQLNKSINQKIVHYKINQIDKLKDARFDFLIIELNKNNIESIINKLEFINNTPYIIISRELKNTKYHGLHLLDVIEDVDLSLIEKKIAEYLKNNKDHEFSIFELTDVMQMISMERKDIAIRIFSKKMIGIIIFENGRPIYAKSIISNKVEFGIDAAFKILSWDNVQFKLIKVIIETPKNLDMDLTNLLIGAMQYKDELANNSSNNNNIEGKCLDYDLIIRQFDTLKGYIGVMIFRNKEEVFSSNLDSSFVKNKDLANNVDKINTLVRNMLTKMGISTFKGVILTSNLATAIIEHDQENKIDVILFLEKDSNIPLSKVMIRKVITCFLH